MDTSTGKYFLLVVLMTAVLSAPSYAQMTMNPYFSVINYPIEQQSFMFMVLPDYQSARYGNNYLTWMLMAEYGLSSRWTAGAMVEGQKIDGQPAAYGGIRINTYFHLFKDSRWLNTTLYGEFEDLNGASLYKMEVAGFGPEDLTIPLELARQTRVRTFEQRLILYHDWDRLNATFNFVRETPLKAPYGSDYGYALGVFHQASWMSEPMPGMPGMTDMETPPLFSLSRLGYGVEMIGGLGDNERFAADWNAQQHYVGAVLTYAISPAWSVRLEPALGLSDVSDPFMLRMGLTFMLGLSDRMKNPLNLSP